MVPLLCVFFVLFGASAKTIVSFSRKLNTCDEKDHPILNATTKLIWSYNNNVPKDENSILYHEHRGFASVRFRHVLDATTVNLLPPLPDADELAIRNQNTAVYFDSKLGKSTTYYCTGFYVPPTNKKMQIVRWEPVIDPRNPNEVHHIVTYMCFGNLTSLGPQGSCYDNAPADITACLNNKIIGAWSVGGVVYDFPPTVGFPIPTDGFYILLEIHYNNPDGKRMIIDSSGLKFYITENLREHDAGFMQVGVIVDNTLSIPPQVSNYKYEAFCTHECTDTWHPFNIISASLHTHVAGASGGMHHYRNGTRLQDVIYESVFDFNYQDMEFLDKEITVLPGDVLHVDCHFNTMDRVNATPFGFPTNEEMCVVSIVYYPALEKKIDYCNMGDYARYNSSWTNDLYCGWDYITNITIPNVPPEISVPCVKTKTNLTVEQTTPVIVHERFNPSNYVSWTYLDKDLGIKMYWNWSIDTQEIHIALEYPTNGWLGWGITHTGMVNGDVIIAWIKDGQPYFSDRYAIREALPPKDEQQDYYNIKFYVPPVDEDTLTPPPKGGLEEGNTATRFSTFSPLLLLSLLSTAVLSATIIL